MSWSFAPMTAGDAAQIAAWRYEAPYDFYDLDADADDMRDFLDPASWSGNLSEDETFFAVRRDGELLGFFSFMGSDESCTVGLGLAPDCTSQGLGESFVREGLAFACETWGVKSFRLEVATFNERAKIVYERVGFRTTRTIRRESNGRMVEFLEMFLTP